MTTVMPDSKRVRDALHWISERLAESTNQEKLVQEAIFHFNLTPKEEEYLNHLFKNNKHKEG